MLSALTLTALTTLAVGGLSGCGSSTSDGSPGGSGGSPSTTLPSASAPDTLVVEPGELVVAHGSLMQRKESGPVELCLGGVAQSYPPQCGGPRIIGDVNWDDLQPERAAGVTWTEGVVRAVGHYDPRDGASGSFTLDRPLTLGTTPEPGSAAAPEPMTFPQLCKDPYAGGGARSGGVAQGDTNPITERLPQLDGYVGSWVSDGSSIFNVLVTGDAAAAHRELRKTWKGGLCVEQRDAATEEDVAAAQDALATTFKGLLSTGGDVVRGRLDVEVILLDQATLDEIVQTVSPWIAAKDLNVTSALQPLRR